MVFSFESIINCIKYKDKRIQLVEDGYESTDKLTVILNEICRFFGRF